MSGLISKSTACYQQDLLRCGTALWSPDQAMEPQNEALHSWREEWHLHH